MRIQVNAKNRSYSFESDSKERVLYAGLRNGVALPYECATGTCGTCKARLIEGKVYDPWPEAPGRKNLKHEQGEFLLCQCVARTDLTVELPNFVYSMDPGACQPESFFGTIRRAKMLVRDVIFLEVEPDKPIDFDAGQFVALSVPGIDGFRGYSMVNFERRAKRLEFVIKRKPGGGLSDWLFGNDSRVEGTAVEIVGPLGHATFYPNIAKNILCIAGGSGIAGMMSILARGMQERYFDQYKGNVFFGVRSMQDAFFLSELSEYASAFPGRLRVVVALSDEAVPAGVSSDYPALQFEQGFVHEVAARQMKGQYQNTRAYLAGPPPAVDAALRVLIIEAKLTTDNIAYDKFS